MVNCQLSPSFWELVPPASQKLHQLREEEHWAFAASAEPLALAAPSSGCEYAQTDLNLISVTSAPAAAHTATSIQSSLCPGGVHTYPEHSPPSGMSLPKIPC